MLYLRARYYNPANGRFQSRDTWGGGANRPLSLNRWNYVEGNPINRADPSGNSPISFECLNNFEGQIATAKEYVPNKNDEMTTFVAASIGIQCMGLSTDFAPGYYNGRGLGQVSKAQAAKGYGEKIFDGKSNANNGKGDFRGTGVLCYVLKELLVNENIPCLFCNTREELEGYLSAGQNFDDIFQLEDKHDPVESRWAVEYTRRKIKQVLDLCKPSFCGPKERFIVAALAQNGPGFPPNEMERIKNRYVSNGTTINWRKWYGELSIDSKNEFRTQWNLFYPIAQRLHNDGYWLPDGNIFNDSDILWLKSQ